MAYGNANEIVLEMAHEVLPVVRRTPVLAGVNGTDPFLLRDDFLRRLGELGFSGVQNFPTVGIIDGVFRANLEETGMGYGARGRADPRRARGRLPHHAVCVLGGERARDGRGGRRHHRLPSRTDHRRRDRRGHRARRSPIAFRASTRGPRRRARSIPTSSCCAMAARSPRPPTPASSWARAASATASMARRAWSGCRPRRRSPRRRASSRTSAREKLTFATGGHHDRRPIRTDHLMAHRHRGRRRDGRVAPQLALPALVEGARLRAHRTSAARRWSRTAGRSCCRSSTR